MNSARRSNSALDTRVIHEDEFVQDHPAFAFGVCRGLLDLARTLRASSDTPA